MQFIPYGPDIPNVLLQAHEEGRVVFFCGAGISYPADLPDFKGLVERIYALSYTTRSGIEQEAFNSGRFDTTLDLLEQRFPGQRRAVRPALAQALEPKLYPKGATNTHTALLRLGRSREGTLRMNSDLRLARYLETGSRNPRGHSTRISKQQPIGARTIGRTVSSLSGNRSGLSSATWPPRKSLHS